MSDRRHKLVGSVVGKFVKREDVGVGLGDKVVRLVDLGFVFDEVDLVFDFHFVDVEFGVFDDEELLFEGVGFQVGVVFVDGFLLAGGNFDDAGVFGVVLEEGEDGLGFGPFGVFFEDVEVDDGTDDHVVGRADKVGLLVFFV